MPYPTPDSNDEMPPIITSVKVCEHTNAYQTAYDRKTDKLLPTPDGPYLFCPDCKGTQYRDCEWMMFAPGLYRELPKEAFTHPNTQHILWGTLQWVDMLLHELAQERSRVDADKKKDKPSEFCPILIEAAAAEVRTRLENLRSALVSGIDYDLRRLPPPTP